MDRSQNEDPGVAEGGAGEEARHQGPDHRHPRHGALLLGHGAGGGHHRGGHPAVWYLAQHATSGGGVRH